MKPLKTPTKCFGESKLIRFWGKAIWQKGSRVLRFWEKCSNNNFCPLFFFRRVFAMVFHGWRCGKSSPMSAAQQLRSINKELGLTTHGAPCAEAVLNEDIDAQSQILCGMSKV